MSVENSEPFKPDTFSKKLSALANSEASITLELVEQSLQHLERISNLLVAKSTKHVETRQLTHIRVALICVEFAILYFPANKQAYSQLISISSVLGYKKQTRAATEVLASGLVLTLEKTLSAILNSNLNTQEEIDVVNLRLQLAIQTAEVVDQLLCLSSHMFRSSYTKYLTEIIPLSILPELQNLVALNRDIRVPTHNLTKRTVTPEYCYAYTKIESWASDSNAKTLQVPQEEWIFDDGNHHLPPHFYPVIADIKRTSLRPLVLSYKRDVSIYSYRPGDDSEIYFPISNCLKIYLSRHSLDEPDYMYSYQLFEESPEVPGAYSLNLDKYYVKRYKIPGKAFLLGGTRNFGHWLMDYVARLVSLYSLPKNQLDFDVTKIPLICPKLDNWQVDLLKLLRIDNPVIETSVEPGQLWQIHCEELLLGGNYSLPTKYKFLRSRVRKGMRGHSSRVEASGSLVYISRTKWDSRTGSYRIEGSEAMDELFKSEGFDVIYPEEESLSNLADKLFSASTIASDSSSNMFNYFLFSNENSIHLNLMARRHYFDDLGIQKGFSFHLPFLDRTIFVFGEQADHSLPLERTSIRYNHKAVIDAIHLAKSKNVN